MKKQLITHITVQPLVLYFQNGMWSLFTLKDIASGQLCFSDWQQEVSADFFEKNKEVEERDLPVQLFAEYYDRLIKGFVKACVVRGFKEVDTKKVVHVKNLVKGETMYSYFYFETSKPFDQDHHAYPFEDQFVIVQELYIKCTQGKNPFTNQIDSEIVVDFFENAGREYVQEIVHL